MTEDREPVTRLKKKKRKRIKPGEVAFRRHEEIGFRNNLKGHTGGKPSEGPRLGKSCRLREVKNGWERRELDGTGEIDLNGLQPCLLGLPMGTDQAEALT